MFSFHKPKVYRSTTGCCICRAKSSSSRFTDSKKYEEDFLECFQLDERRAGEICNACVLLVKRWKKLPAGSERNWRHVVDARAGPGTKSLTKFKSKNKKMKLNDNSDNYIKLEKTVKKKHIYGKNDESMREDSPALSDDNAGDDFMSELSALSIPSSPTPSEEMVPVKRRRSESPSSHSVVSGFLDMTIWKRQEICCGTIFKGPCGEIVVDPQFLKPCNGCRQEPVQYSSQSDLRSNGSLSNTQNKLIKNFSDSSSDSGYDESSNQGLSVEGLLNRQAECRIHSNESCLN